MTPEDQAALRSILRGPGRRVSGREPPAEAERLRALVAERETWIVSVGHAGWRAELVRRRAVRNAGLRLRRAAGYAREG